MKSQWDTWLRQLVADGKGGFGLRSDVSMKTIDRGLAYTYTFGFSADYHSDSFEASLSLGPDAGSALVNFTVTVGAYSGGVTNVTVSLTAAQTAALPTDDDGDGLAEVVFDLLRNPGGAGDYARLLAGRVLVSGTVTAP